MEPLLKDTSLYRTLLQVPKVSSLEGFHCSVCFYPGLLYAHLLTESQQLAGESVEQVWQLLLRYSLLAGGAQGDYDVVHPALDQPAAHRVEGGREGGKTVLSISLPN